MSRVYSTLFYRGDPAGSTPTYVVPAGYVAIIRDIEAGNLSGAAGYAVVNVDLAGFIIVPVPAPGALASQGSWSGRTVANAGDTIYFGNSAEYIYLMVSGYLLTV